MKNKTLKRSLCVLLAALMLFGLLAPSALGNQRHPFTDVGNTWYSEAVQFVWENNIMTGTTPVTFAPDAPLTRAQLVTILWRTEGEPATSWRNQFTDVSAGQWYSSAVIWAFDNGIVTGTSPTTFAPGANITREQFATMMHRYAEFAGQDTSVPANFNLNNFTDHGNISSWALTAMRWAVYTELIGGTGDNMLSPGGNATRAQAAVILTRYLGGIDETPTPQSVNIVPLLGRNIDEVKHLFGSSYERSEWSNAQFSGVVYEFGHARVDTTPDGRINRIEIIFVDSYGTPQAGRSAFNVNGIDGTTTRAEIRAQLGMPTDFWPSSYYGYTNLDFTSYMTIYFDAFSIPLDEAIGTDLPIGFTIRY